ncbi:spore germination protein, partial [Oceanobacillus massiliensis]
MRKNRKSKSTEIFPLKIDQLEPMLQNKFDSNNDLSFSVYEHQNKKIAVFYIPHLVAPDKVENLLLKSLLESNSDWTATAILNNIPLSFGQEISKLEEILTELVSGKVFIYIEDEDTAVNYMMLNVEKRSLSKAETETVVIGPQVAFTESIVTNINILRWRIRTPDLVLEKIMVGKRYPREVRLVYVKSVANETDVNTMRQRIQELDIDEIEDNNVLMQFIEDSSVTIFPQFYSTELPDRASYAITKGRVGVLMENSPNAILAPSTIFSFFESTEDIYMRWNLGSFLRILRFVAMFISITLTPLYVAGVTYHFETIPTQLLVSVGQSRASVPFP